jgi:glycosyltransferase involved in cell wall biosynthesis
MCPAPLRGLTILDSQVRVALFAEWDPDAPGGLRTTTAGLVDHSPDDIHVIPYLNQPGFSSLLRVNELIARLQRQRIELVHIASCGHVALVALLLAAKLHLPLVGSFDLDSLTTTALRRRYLRTLSEVCHKVLVSSACAHETLRRLMDPAHVAAWRPGVDIETFTPRKRSASLREQWQVSPDRAAVIYAGTLSEEHGVWRLLSLELELRRTRPMHRLIVAGDGAALMRLRYKCPHAIFLGHVPDSQMPELLASADVFVSPSERQSTHHAVLEAQASGLPVVVMAKGAARERTTTDAAIVCRSDADFIVGTAALVRTEDRRASMGRAARQHALAQRWESGLAPLFAQYRALAASSRPVRPESIGVVREHRVNS